MNLLRNNRNVYQITTNDGKAVDKEMLKTIVCSLKFITRLLNQINNSIDECYLQGLGRQITSH